MASGWQWSLTLTPGAQNIITTAAKSLPKIKNSATTDLSAQGLADISANTNQENDTAPTTGATNPWFLFFTVLAITVILSAIILFIKSKKYVRT